MSAYLPTRAWRTRLTALSVLTALVASLAALLLATPSRAAAAPLLRVGPALGLPGLIGTNRPPVASPVTLQTGFQQSTSANLASHVSDPDGPGGDAGTWTITAPPAHGAATLTGSQVSYAPARGFSGSDAFSYRACEGGAPPETSCSRPATVSVTVGRPASATSVTQPKAVHPRVIRTPRVNPGDTVLATGEPTPSIALTPTSGPPGTAVTAEGNMVAPPQCAESGNHVVFHGSSEVDAHASPSNADSTRYSATFTVPSGTFVGDVRVEFRQDGCGIILRSAPATRSARSALDSSVEATFTVTNQRPVASPFEMRAAFEQSTSDDLAAHVSDPDGEDGYTTSFPITTQPAHGTVTLDGSRLTYTPAQGYSGPDSLGYQACERDHFDGALACSDPATVSVTVRRPTPSITVSPASGPAGSSFTAQGDIFGPDTCDPNGNYIVFHGNTDVTTPVTARDNGDGTFGYSTAVAVPPGTFVGRTSVEIVQDCGGVVTLRSTGEWTGGGFSAETFFTVTNTPPQAQPFALATGFQQSVTADLAAHATDPDANDGYAESFAIVDQPADGTASLSGSRVTYTPNTDFLGSDSFTYRACETDSNSEGSQPDCGPPATVSVTVGPPTPSIALAPTSGPPGTTVRVTGDMFGPRTCATSGNHVVFHGNREVTVGVTPHQNADGTFGYATSLAVPPGTFAAGQSVEFRQDSCGEGGSRSASATFTVTNRPPAASPFRLQTRFQQGVTADLAAHVTDPDGRDGYAESFAVIALPAHGIATLSGSRVTYTPEGGFLGTDSFTYQVCEFDSAEGPPSCSGPATVSVTVTRPAVAVSLATDPATACTGARVTLAARVREDGQPLPGADVTFRMSLPGHGVVTRTDRTDPAGRAAVTYQRSTAGNDSVTARVTSVAGALPATAGPVVVRWTACPTGTTPVQVTPIKPVVKPPPVQPVVPVGDHSVRATDPSPLAGSTNAAVGHGCAPGAPVDLRLGAETVGSGQADPSGRFRIPFRVPSLPVGRHPLVATCGPVTSTTPIDFVTTASAGGSSGAAVTTVAAVFLFFVLLGSHLLRPGLGGASGVPTSL